MTDGKISQDSGNAELLQYFKIFEDFAKGIVLDAFVVLDRNGRVVKANQQASAMLKVGTKQMMRAESLDQILTFQVDGKPLPLSELLNLDHTRREDIIDGISAAGENKLILLAYPFHEGGRVIGTFLVMREITGETSQGEKIKESTVKAMTDMLSGLFNRNGLEEHLRDRKKAVETLPEGDPGRVHSVLMMDIDHFKKVNDTYGHPAGDYVIQSVAKLVKASCRHSDVAFRVGGEEFLVIFTATALEGALVAAEKVRTTVQNHRFEFEGTHIPVTVSVGVATLDVTSADPHVDITRADAALYFSKQNGRNRVSLHDGVVLKPYQWQPPIDNNAAA